MTEEPIEMNLQEAMANYLPLIEEALQAALATPRTTVAQHHGMMHYHLGWVNERLEARPSSGGKRLRPLLCLLTCQAAGGDALTALPAATAIEILHNFSLAHDDIEDNSPTRRGRAALWTLWGVPQAINVGDALSAIARRTLGELLQHGVPAERVMEATQAFDATCVALTEGQYLDMDFERRLDVSVDEYVEMIGGKTAGLIGLSARLGASLAGAPAWMVSHFREFGWDLGLAFQIEDDILGIWGDESATGKSASTDILEKKKSLPVVYALGSDVGAELQAIYRKPKLTRQDIAPVLGLLDEVDALGYTRQMADEAYQSAHTELMATGLGEAALLAVRELAAILRGRSH